MTRTFLGWDLPLVKTAAGYLSEHFASQGGGVDLTQVIVVVPGRRMGRLLIEEMARSRGTVIGEVWTIDQVLDRVLANRGATPASSWIRRLAWAGSASALTDEQRDRLWPASVQDSVMQRLAMADAIDSAARRLGGDGYEFADAERAVQQAQLPDAGRWNALSSLCDVFRENLRKLGLTDEVRERIEAAKRGGSDPLERLRVVLVGLVELPGLLRSVLGWDRIDATALIAAPEAHRTLFDALGAVDPEAWRDERVLIDDAMIRVVEGPREEAEAAILAAGSGSEDPASVVIATPDDEVRVWMERLAPWLAEPEDGREPLRVRAVEGSPATESAPGRLLRLVFEFLADPEFVPFAALLRHRMLEGAVLRHAAERGGGIVGPESEILPIIDQYATRYVHGVVDGKWLGDTRQGSVATMHGVLATVYLGVVWVLGDLWSGDRPCAARAISKWAGPIVSMVRRVFDDSADERDVRACAAIERAARMLRSGSVFANAEPEVSPDAAIRLVLGEIGRERIPEEKDPGAIEMVGWLDAVHDPAGTLILTGMNEGFVPRVSSSDAMIPEGLKRSLGLWTRDGILARDACLLKQAISCRKSVVIIAGRRGGDGTRLWPSRLLMVDDDRRVVGRLRLFLSRSEEVGGPPGEERPALAGSRAVHPAFELMPVIEHEEVNSVRVTAFKQYMQSPYAFYLSQVLGLGEVQDEAVEMEASVFGSYIHRVLERFAVGPARNSGDPEAVQSEIERCAEAVAAMDAGASPPTAVAVQMQQALYRLRGFAAWQAARAAEGWEILATEWQPKQRVTLDVEGQVVALRGRIDRIDFHPGKRELALLDYKTGEDEGAKIRSMYKADRAEKAWRDLQLPLYRHMAAELITEKKPAKVTLGYITIPKDGGTQLVEGEWSDADLDRGIDMASDLARQMIQGLWRVRGAEPPDQGAGGALCGVSVILSAATQPGGTP